MQKWEYLVIEVTGKVNDVPMVGMVNGESEYPRRPLPDFLRELGEEGWEMFAVDDYVCYLKRPKE